MPQLDFTTLPTQLFWLLVTFITLYLLMAKVALPKVTLVLQSRREKISGDLDKASSMSEEARSLEKEYEHSISYARQRANGLVAEALQQVNALAAEKLEELNANLVVQTKTAEEKINKARDKAVDELSKAAVELADLTVNKLTEMKIPSNKIADVVDELVKLKR